MTETTDAPVVPPTPDEPVLTRWAPDEPPEPVLTRWAPIPVDADD